MIIQSTPRDEFIPMPVRNRDTRRPSVTLPAAAGLLRQKNIFALTGWIALGLVVIIQTGCSESAARNAEPNKPTVRVSKPLERKVIDYVYFTGRTDAVDAVNIQARVTGYLNSVDFTPGREVKKGDQLFKIDPRPYQATLDEANSQVKLAEARLELAIADLARAKEVARTPGAISKQDLDKYAAAQSEAAASVQAAKANAEAAQLNLEFTNINSPIDGRVGRNLLTIGNLVKQDTTLLTTVVSQDPMYAYFNVDEHTMLRVQKMIREGKVPSGRDSSLMPVEMGLANEGNRYPHEGKIDFVNNRVDPSTGTLQVRGSFPNPEIGQEEARLLSPGLFVRIRVPLGAPTDSLLIPQAAVNTDQGLKYLLVVNAEGVVEYRPIQLGSEQPGGLQVMLPVKMVKTEQGLQMADADTPADVPTVPSLTANDQVIVSGLQMVRPAMKVDVREVDIAPPTEGMQDNSAGDKTDTENASPSAAEGDSNSAAKSSSDAKPSSSTETPAKSAD